MANTNNKGPLVSRKNFPNSTQTNLQKDSLEFGRQVGKAIESEWFKKDTGSSNCLFYSQWGRYEELRQYARGVQSISKYQRLFKVNGDNSYLNIDWTAIPIGEKFVDVVVNGMNERLFTPKAIAQDAMASEKRDMYQQTIEKDMVARQFLEQTKKQFGIDAYNVENPDDMPQNSEELQLHMQLRYKPAIEIATEVAISNVFEMNNFSDTKYRFEHDLVTLGKSIGRAEYIPGEGLRISYCDPQYCLHSFTEDPFHRDLFYIGEIKLIPILELKKINPNLTDEDIKEIKEAGKAWSEEYSKSTEYADSLFQDEVVSVLYFNYKTDRSIVHKIKSNEYGKKKAILRDESFNPEGIEGVTRIGDKIDVWYDGVMVLGTDKVLRWQLSENMIRPNSAFKKVYPNYVIVAPKMQSSHNKKITSTVSKMIPFIDQIQLIHLKIQQVVQRMVPDGIFIDADGFSDIDLGDGGTYNAKSAVDMFFQTGSVIGRSYTSDGDFNNAKMPIKEIVNGASQQKISALITMYNHNMNMLRDVTGINTARDGSDMDPKSLVGLQKMAALNSNVATRHILEGSLFMTKELAVRSSLLISDILKFSPEREAFANQIGQNHVSILETIMDIPLHSMGIFIEVSPDEEEKALLNKDIETALSQKLIELEDSIEIRSIKNIKIALELLKLKKKRKQEQDDAREKMKMEMQTASNIQSAREAAKAKMEQVEAEKQAKIELEMAKTQGSIAVFEKQGEVKSRLMAEEFNYKLKLEEMVNESLNTREDKKEKAKDDRVDKQSTQQSKMIDQRNKKYGPTNFESREGTLDDLDIMGM